jgi:hypothetical protein
MKLALKHVVTAIILILSLTAPVAAGPHEDARAVTGYNAGGFNPYTGQPSPPLPQGLDLHSIDKNGEPIPFKYDPATGQRIGAQPAPQDRAALSAKGQEILDAQTRAAPGSQPPPRPAARPAPTVVAPVPQRTDTGLPPGALTPFQGLRVPGVPLTGYNAGQVPAVRGAQPPPGMVQDQTTVTIDGRQYQVTKDGSFHPAPVVPLPRLAPAPSVGTTACQRYPNLC